MIFLYLETLFVLLQYLFFYVLLRTGCSLYKAFVEVLCCVPKRPKDCNSYFYGMKVMLFFKEKIHTHARTHTNCMCVCMYVYISCNLPLIVIDFSFLIVDIISFFRVIYISIKICE
jgi:hypothetical protein